MKSREQSLFAGLLQKQNRTQLAIISSGQEAKEGNLSG